MADPTITERLPAQPGSTPVPDHYVVDTGVFLRWFVDQSGYEHARSIEEKFHLRQIGLVTTDLARVELGHVLRTKGLVPGYLDRETYIAAIGMLDAIGIDIRPTDPITLTRAAGWAVRWNLRFFDALFVDLAIETGYRLLTSDLRLARAVGHVVPVEVLQGV